MGVDKDRQAPRRLFRPDDMNSGYIPGILIGGCIACVSVLCYRVLRATKAADLQNSGPRSSVTELGEEEREPLTTVTAEPRALPVASDVLRQQFGYRVGWRPFFVALAAGMTLLGLYYGAGYIRHHARGIPSLAAGTYAAVGGSALLSWLWRRRYDAKKSLGR